MLTDKLKGLFRIGFIVTALYCQAETATIEVPGENYAYQPVGVVSTPRGFILASNSMEKADTGWDISLLELDGDFNVITESILTGNGSNTVRKIISLDDGIILLGNTTSSEGIFNATEGLQDIVVARLDEQMRIRWSSNLGSIGLSHAQDICVSTENGTVTVMGWINGPSAKIPDHFGGWDIVVAQYDLDGSLRWTKTLGGREDDIAGTLLSVEDSVYISYNSWSDKRKWNIELVRLDNKGRVRWRKDLGGSGSDQIVKLIHTQNELIALGSTDSDDFVPIARGSVDIFVLGLTERGRSKWGIRLGGSRDDFSADIVATNRQLTILGWSESNDIDVYNHLGGKDIVVFNLGIENLGISSYTFGTLDDDWPLQIISFKDHFYTFGASEVSERIQQPFWIKLN